MKGSTPAQIGLPSSMGARSLLLRDTSALGKHDANCAGRRAQGSLGTSVVWYDWLNSPSPTIDTLTFSEVTAPHGRDYTTHTLLNRQSGIDGEAFTCSLTGRDRLGKRS